MNKPTRSEIEHRAVEILLNLKEAGSACQICKYRGDLSCCGEVSCSNALMESALEKAEKELTSLLTHNQKHQLEAQLNKLQELTKNKYESLEYDTLRKKMYLYFFDKGGERKFDVINGGSFITFADDVFELNKEYDIQEELLNG